MPARQIAVFEQLSASEAIVQPEMPSELKGSRHSPLDPETTSWSDAGAVTSFSYSVCAGYSTPCAPPASANTDAMIGEATLVPPMIVQPLLPDGVAVESYTS